MPTYGYQCTQCQHKFDVFQKMSDDPLSVCPECSGAVKRLFYPVGVVFKGSGWYINDSRKPEKNSDGDSAKPETKSETKTETKSGDSPAASDTSAKSEPAATTSASS